MLKKVFGGIMCLSACASFYSNAATITQNFLRLDTGTIYHIPPTYGRSFVIDVSPSSVTIGRKRATGMSSPLVISPTLESETKSREALLPGSSPMSAQPKYDEYYLYSGKIQSAIDLARTIMDGTPVTIIGQDEEVLCYTKSLLRLCNAESKMIDIIDEDFFGTDLYYSADPYISSLSNLTKSRPLDAYKLLITQDGAKGFRILLSFRKFALERGVKATEFDTIEENFRLALGTIGNTCDTRLIAIFLELKRLS